MAQETTMTMSTYSNEFNQFTPKEFKHPLFGNLNVLKDSNGKLWFIGVEVARCLGYQKPENAIYNLPQEYKYKYIGKLEIPNKGISSWGGARHTMLLSEQGLIELIGKSDLNNPVVRQFKDWANNVIVDMRQYGMSMSDQLMGYSKEELADIVLTQREALDAAQPAIHMYHQATNDDATITTKQIADNYGWTAQKLNSILYKLGFHYPSGDGWVLYKQYKDQGLVSTVTRQTNEGLVEFTTGYTEKGRNLVDQLLHDNGYKTRYESQDDIDRRIQIANDRANQYNQQQYYQPQQVYNYNNYFFGSNPDETWNQIRQIPDPVARGNAMKAFSNHIHDKAAAKGYSNCPLVDKYGNPF